MKQELEELQSKLLSLKSAAVEMKSALLALERSIPDGEFKDKFWKSRADDNSCPSWKELDHILDTIKYATEVWYIRTTFHQKKN